MQLATETARVANRAQRRQVRQPLEALGQPGAHLRLDVVLAVAGISRSQWYRLMAANEAPKSLKFGPRCSRWLASDISKFLADRTAKGAK